MDTKQLNELSIKIQISPDQLIREEAELLFLNELANHPLGQKLAFYGGTALRLAYGSPRFSEDIDLISIKKTNFADLTDLAGKIARDNPKWRLKDIKHKRQTIFALFLIKDENLKHAYSLKIEIHQPAKKVRLPLELRLIKSPTSVLEPLLLVPTLPALQQLKINALANRKKARDIFDLWYIAQTQKTAFKLPAKLSAYSQREFQNELKVFLPKKYYPIIKQLYESLRTTD